LLLFRSRRQGDRIWAILPIGQLLIVKKLERQQRHFFVAKRFNGNLASWLAVRPDLTKHFLKQKN
jgi:hypothetical protein